MRTELIRKNKILIALYIISTALFLYQHYDNLSWDFSVYVMNGEYWAGKSDFYETQRAPLMPFVMLILSPLGVASEYIYIMLASALFLYSSIRLADALKLRREIFYLFSLTPYAILFGLINGTEILSLALLELFAASLIERKNTAGLFLGLACLARYNFMIFLPLLLFDNDIRRIIRNGILFALPFVPWFVYNFVKYGNMFTLIADSYALNFVFRDYINQSMNLDHFLSLTTYLLPFFIAGIGIVAYELAKSAKDVNPGKLIQSNRSNIIIIAVLLLSVYQYAETPIKDVRYIFPLVMPVAYFSALSVERFLSNVKDIPVYIIVSFWLIFTLLGLVSLGFFEPGEKKDMYISAIEETDRLGIGNCRLMSNEWTVLNYLGRTTEPYPWQELAYERIEEGYHMLFFYKTGEPEWVRNDSFMSQFPVIFENDKFVIIGDEDQCLGVRPVDWLYLDARNQTNFEVYGESIDMDPCNIIFDSRILQGVCRVVNLKGY